MRDPDMPVPAIAVDEQTRRCLSLWASAFRLHVVDAVREMRNGAEGIACAWFKSRSNRPGGFLWCCDILGLTPETVRAKLLANRRSIYAKTKDVPEINDVFLE